MSSIKAIGFSILYGFALMLSQGSAASQEQQLQIADKIELVKFLNNNSVERPTVKSAEEAREMVSSIHFKIFNVVKKICREEKIPAKNCTWNVRVERRPGFQAYAYNVNEIVIHSGLIDKTTFEEEVAFVAAHEIGHHIFDHVYQKKRSIFIGAVLGFLSGVGPFSGATLGVLNSRAQSVGKEQAADMIASRILSQAGYDLGRARLVLIRMAKMDGRSKTRFLASHPAGLERLLSFDNQRKSQAE